MNRVVPIIFESTSEEVSGEVCACYGGHVSFGFSRGNGNGLRQRDETFPAASAPVAWRNVKLHWR